MAKRDGNFLIGTIGKFAFKKVRGIQVVQSKPGKGNVKQTTATKAAAGLFGRGSSLASDFRKSNTHIIQGFYDGEMIGRLTKEVVAVIRQCYQEKTKVYDFGVDSFKSLEGFDFNSKSPLQKSLWINPQSSFTGNTLTITLPALKVPEELKFPPGANLCKLKICVSLFNLQEGKSLNTKDLRTLEVMRNQQILEQTEFTFQVPDGCLCLATIGLHYYTKGATEVVVKNSKIFNPAAICGIYVKDGIFNPEKPVNWTFNAKAVFN